MPIISCVNTSIYGLKLIIPEIYEDYRGSYTETYDYDKWREYIGSINFVADGVSTSRKNVLRGIHGDYDTIKLVCALYGTYYSVIVDNRPESSTYRSWQAFILSHTNKHQLLIPAGCGNSVLALDDYNVYHYKQSSHYIKGRQFTLLWNDPKLNIKWPTCNPILSERDSDSLNLI